MSPVVARLASLLGVTLLVACVRSTVHDGKPEAVVLRDPVDAAADVDVAAAAPCPSDMVLVEGDYCPQVRQVCLQWVDRKGKASKEAVPADNDSGRCGTFRFPSECLSTERVHKRFCIDRFEYPNVAGQRPMSWMSWWDSKAACESQGKRLCEKQEWTFACEGEEMRPLPYGDGYHRDPTACNIDNSVPDDVKDIQQVSRHDSAEGRALDDVLVLSGSMPRCVSPFGVYDMVGNVDELVVNSQGHHWKSQASNDGKLDRGPFVSGLVGGHVFGVRNACRPMTTAHNESFAWYESGSRCCSKTLE